MSINNSRFWTSSINGHYKDMYMKEENIWCSARLEYLETLVMQIRNKNAKVLNLRLMNDSYSYPSQWNKHLIEIDGCNIS